MIVPVLLAGGSGTRLWPLSRQLFPKQFLKLVSDNTLLQDTALRAARLPDAAPPIVICGEQHRFIVAEQLRGAGIDRPTILLEPEGRNTAPAAAVAALQATERYGHDALVFLMSADHAIPDTEAFVDAATRAAAVAARGYLTTFGIKPSHPETGYGYIRAGKALDGGGHGIDEFVEKPDAERARQYLQAGDYYWNAGMFMFPAGLFLDELRALEPEMAEYCTQALINAERDLDFVRLNAEAFAQCRDDSIDYAVMEKTQRGALVPMDAGWDDVGSWTFMAKLPPTDDAGNRVRGDAMLEGVNDSLVLSDGPLIGAVGVRDQVIVATKDAVLVTTRDRAQDVKALVTRLRAQGRSEADAHPRVARPWGSYETIAIGPRFQVKRIIVKPGQKLSLQMHHHRAEHWVVVSGTAKVTCDEREMLLTEDQSTYIPLGARHRLENPGKVPLELIEVQSGAYLGEDDIVRFDDVYGRTQDAAAGKPKP